MTIAVYGIPNCDTVRKARKWLEQQHVDFTFHDVRATPVPPETLFAWLAQLGQDTVINKRSTAWRQFSETEQQISNADQAVALLQQHPTLMKRPLLDVHGQFIAGFNETKWQHALEQR
ncbi:Spx/MgsR family RNA polymerase-binding regulatory protein [Pseudidiomarina sp.]|uniref:Spx/MgsR family RNA polymerase-binding regulatory protein n=1 Tax=Pseudidiomarina sp. TaxID=2081707 RepID=UPI003A97D8F7